MGDAKRKKIVVAGLSSLILIAMVIGVTVGIRMRVAKPEAAAPPKEVSASMKAVEALCQPTDYRETCVESLSQTNTTDPKELIIDMFKVAMQKLEDAARRSTVLRELEKDSRASMALENCHELVQYSINDLKTSSEELGAFDLTKLEAMLANLKIWLSASITYQETCLDGFQNTTGNAGEQMRQALKISSQLTSISLALVTEFSKITTSLTIPGLTHRRLLTDDHYENDPNWVEHANRKLLTDDHYENDPNWIEHPNRRLLSVPTVKITPNVVVAKDGSGNFTTINDALPLIKKKSNESFVIYVKAGVYKEYVVFNSSMRNVMLIGDGPKKTIITGNKNWVDGIPTSKTATVTVLGDFFIAKDIGIENSAGAIKHQAVALRVQSDKSIFQNCQMDGYQDTLYCHTKRQYYRDCTISGTIDFVFGDAAAVFQNCTFVVRKPMINQQCIVTAQGRNESRQTTGIVIQNSKFIAAPEFFPVRKTFRAYLGRPWKAFSRTIIMNSFIDDLIVPEGWMPWQGTFALDTLFYAEYQNTGPGSIEDKRVTWPGIKSLSDETVLEFLAGRFIEGDTWIPTTDTPYASGFMTKDPPVTILSKSSSRTHA